MEILKKIALKAADYANNQTPTIAFIGDSVTQGCFEIYPKNGGAGVVFDKMYAYHKYLADILAILYPSAPINIINAGISGDTAPNGLARLQRDVLSHHPDLTVVCYGLNDSVRGMEDIHIYCDALRQIFTALQDAGGEVIFMTANMMCNTISYHLLDVFRNTAQSVMKIQNEGILKAYFQKGKEIAKECNIPVCDVYEIWEQMAENGVQITDLLSNHINHPTRELNWLFALSLIQQMLKS